MITMSMYTEIQNFKRQGKSIKDICSAVGASRNTVRKYYRMSDDDFHDYLQRCKIRGKKFEPFSDEIITLYKENEGKESVYELGLRCARRATRAAFGK